MLERPRKLYDASYAQINHTHDELPPNGKGAVYTRATRQIISGAGLTGGGDLTADRTLAVGAGTGIAVAADAVSVDINGLTADATPDGAADYVMTYDASAATLKKVLLDNLPGGGGGGGTVDSVVGTLNEIVVDATDPANPIVSLAAAITSVLASAVQPGDLDDVAFSGAYADLSGTPSLHAVATSGDHGALGGLTDDDHTQYVLRSILTTNGDLFTRTGGAIARLGVGSDDDVLTVVAGAPAWAPASGGGSGQIVVFNTYTADDTWTKPTGFAWGIAIGIGQGGGGGSGRLGAAGSGRVGGGGGGGAGRSVRYFGDADASATEAVTVNGGGQGGVARTAAAQDGADGTAGADTTFGSLLTAEGGGGGIGGTSSGNAAAGAGGQGNAGFGGDGGTGYATSATAPATVAGASTGAGGGAGGCGVSSGNVQGNGAVGASNAAGTATGGARGLAGNNPGSDGDSNSDHNCGAAGGGSGGGSNNSAVDPGAAGNGGDYGGGGAGGSAGTVLAGVGNSPKGGDGGDGILLVISFCNIGAGTGIVDSVVGSAYIDVDSSDPTNPIVSLDFAALEGAAPTWTDVHTFTNRVDFTSTSPLMRYTETDGGSDAKIWRFGVAGESYFISTRTDLDAVGGNAISFDRSGTTVTAVTIGSTAQDTTFLLPSVSDAVTPTLAFLGDLDTGFYRVAANTIGAAAAGALQFEIGNGYISIPNARRLTNVISPAQLVANTNNWNPTGLSTASSIRYSTDAARDLTGIVAQAAGTRITLINIGAQNSVLKHDVTSTSTNRFLCPGAADYTLNAGDAVDIWYDTTSSRWRVLAAA